MGFGLLLTHDLGAGFMSDVEGEAADLAKDGAEGEQEGGDGELFALNGKQVRAQSYQCDEEQGEEDGQDEEGSAFGHGGNGVRWFGRPSEKREMRFQTAFFVYSTVSSLSSRASAAAETRRKVSVKSPVYQGSGTAR